MTWIHWIVAVAGHRRRKDAPRDLGVELLESRTVLSASLGPSHYDRGTMDGGAMIARPDSMANVGRQTYHAFGAWFDHHRDHSRPDGLEGPPHDTSRADRFSQALSIESVAPPTTAPIATAPIVVAFVPNFGRASNNESQSRSSQPERPPARPEEFGRPSATNGHSTLQSIDPTGFFVAFAMPHDPEQSQASLDPRADSTTATTRLTSPTSQQAIDTAIQEYSASRLLRAVSVDEDSDEDDDALQLDGWASSDGEAESFAALTSAQLDQGITTALEVLSRERKAVEAMLGELHQPASDAVQDRQDSATNPPPAADDIDSPSTASSAEGMVWLVPTGDANASAWNLTAAFLKRTPTVGKAPAGVEVSLGIYQAFDIGETQALPATTMLPTSAASYANLEVGSQE